MNIPQPDLSLNMDAKIYLAVSKPEQGKFVYTLACLKTEPKSRFYEVFATREMQVFKNIDSANMYYEAVNATVDQNKKEQRFSLLFSMNKEMIQNFNAEHTR